MKVYYDLDLHNFEAWSGGKETLDELTYDQIDRLNELMEEMYADDNDVSETTINDLLWFERDYIAELLGYKDWECLENVHKYGDEVKVFISNIEWDIDEEEMEEDDIELPTEVTETFEYNGNNEDLEDDISEWLSDEYGYCHCGFKFKIVEE